LKNKSFIIFAKFPLFSLLMILIITSLS